MKLQSKDLVPYSNQMVYPRPLLYNFEAPTVYDAFRGMPNTMSLMCKVQKWEQEMRFKIYVEDRL